MSQKYDPRTRAAIAVLLSLSLSLAACGGDSDSDSTANVDDTPAPSDGGQGGDTALPLEYFISPEGLYAVPPSQPNAYELVDSNYVSGGSLQYGFPIFSGDVNNANVTNLQVDSLMYIRSDNTFGRASTDPALFPPSPTQVSSEDGLDRLCSAPVGQESGYANPDSTPFVYALATLPDANCSDAFSSADLTWHFVLASDSATTAPRTFATPDSTAAGNQPPIANLLDSDRNNAGWLIIQNDQLTRLSADGSVANPNIIAVTDSFSTLGQQLVNGLLLLNIDGQLMAFDPADNSISDLGQAISAAAVSVTDGNEGYFVEPEATGAQLYRTTGNGNGVALIDEGAELSGTALTVGASHIVWRDGLGSSADIRSVPKDATATDSGTVIASGEIELVTGNSASGEWIFYNEFDDSSGVEEVKALARRMNGTDAVIFNDARFAEGRFGFAYSLTSEGQANSTSTIGRLYLVDGVMNAADTPAGKAIVSISADDPVNTEDYVNLGVIPGELDDLDIFFGYGPGRLFTLGITDSTVSAEMFYFNDSQPGSIVQVTDNNGPELGVPFF